MSIDHYIYCPVCNVAMDVASGYEGEGYVTEEPEKVCNFLVAHVTHKPVLLTEHDQVIQDGEWERAI